MDARADAVVERREVEGFRIDIAEAVLVVFVDSECGRGAERDKRLGRQGIQRVGIERVERRNVLVEAEIVTHGSEPEFGMRDNAAQREPGRGIAHLERITHLLRSRIEVVLLLAVNPFVELYRPVGKQEVGRNALAFIELVVERCEYIALLLRIDALV